MQDITVYTEDGGRVGYHAHAIAWVMHNGRLHAVVYIDDGDSPWLVAASQVSIKE